MLFFQFNKPEQNKANILFLGAFPAIYRKIYVKTCLYYIIYHSAINLRSEAEVTNGHVDVNRLVKRFGCLGF